MWSAITPLAFIDRAVGELADTDSVPFVVLEIALIFLAVLVDQLTHTVLQALAHRSVVDLASNLLHVLDRIIDKRVPAVWDSRFDYGCYSECSGCLFQLSPQDALLSHRTNKLRILIIDQLFKLSLRRLEFHG